MLAFNVGEFMREDDLDLGGVEEVNKGGVHDDEGASALDCLREGGGEGGREGRGGDDREKERDASGGHLVIEKYGEVNSPKKKGEKEGGRTMQ